MVMEILTLGVLSIPLLIFFAGIFLFWLATLIDILKRDFEKDSDRIVWVLVALFLGIIGSIIYALVKKPDLGTLGKVGKYLTIAGLIMFVLAFFLMFFTSISASTTASAM